MDNKREIVEIREEATALRNEGIEQGHRADKQLVMVPAAQVKYYQGLEGLLDRALDLAAANHPAPAPMVLIDAGMIEQVTRKVTADVIGELAGLAGGGMLEAGEPLTPDPSPAGGRGEKARPVEGKVKAGANGRAKARKKGIAPLPRTKPRTAREKDLDAFAGAPSVEWLPLDTLLKRDYPGTPRPPKNTVQGAIYSGQIKSRGKYTKKVINVASYQQWLAKWAKRG